MKKKETIQNTIFMVLVCALFVTYLGIFIWLNTVQYTQHVDSDIAAETLLTREIWNSKSLTPDNWISSTERKVLGISAMAAPIYGICGSITLSMGIACVIAGGLMLLSMGLLLYKAKLSPLGVMTALLAICALPINGTRNDGQIVPFVMLLWFLFADYYALYCIYLFVGILYYFRLRDLEKGTGKLKIWDFVIWGALLIYCAGLGLSGMRCLQVFALPMMVWEVISLFCESDRFTRKLPAKRWIPVAFVGSVLAVGAAVQLHPSSKPYPMFLLPPKEMMERITSDVPAMILECLGIAGNTKISNFAGLMQVAVFAIIALTVYGLIYVLGKRNHVEKKQVALVQIFGIVLLLTVFIECVSTAERAHYYFFSAWFVIVTIIAILVTEMQARKSLFGYIIVACVCVFAICNIGYTYKHALTTKDNLKEYKEVVDFMEEEELSYGYAGFWDANRIAAISDGQIYMGSSPNMEYLEMFWCLTNADWYVPNLPEEMQTAYVVRQEIREDFLKQFPDGAVMEPEFENELFVVFVSDRNYVSMQ